MSRDDVELVRRTYEAYARGDLPATASAYSEDTVWDVSRFRPDVETHRGQEELAEAIVFPDPEDAFAAAGTS